MKLTFQIHKHGSTFLWRVCWRTYRKSLTIGAIIKILSDLSALIGPLSIGYILEFINNEQRVGNNTEKEATNLQWLKIIDDNNDDGLNLLHLKTFFNNAYVMAFVVLMSTILQSTFSNNFNHLVISEAIHLKSALYASILP